jgi:hypothetical protein
VKRYCTSTTAPRPPGRQRLDQHRRLDRHVQRPDDFQTLERLLLRILLRTAISPASPAPRA